MKHLKKIALALIFAPFLQAIDQHDAQWTVIGAGPTGIMSVGLILDHGIAADKIVWIDDQFNVGRMGNYYTNVPGNGRVEQYIAFLNQCSFFKDVQSEAIQHLYALPLEHTPALEVLVNPLRDITQYLQLRVIAIKDRMIGLDYRDNQWRINTSTATIVSEHVVLATGAHPKTITLEGVQQIPLDQALDKDKLATHIAPTDCVGIIGSGHSAILIIKYLTELSVTRIVNFFKKPIVYPVQTRMGIAWQEAGLKGDVAHWAKTVLEVNPPQNVLRILNTAQALREFLPHCTKVIYAAGFERNELPGVNGDASVYDAYDRHSGLIAPNLHGVGIAFPQQKVDPLGNIENLVGLPYVTFEGLIEALNPTNQENTPSPSTTPK